MPRTNITYTPDHNPRFSSLSIDDNHEEKSSDESLSLSTRISRWSRLKKFQLAVCLAAFFVFFSMEENSFWLSENSSNDKFGIQTKPQHNLTQQGVHSSTISFTTFSAPTTSPTTRLRPMTLAPTTSMNIPSPSTNTSSFASTATPQKTYPPLVPLLEANYTVKIPEFAFYPPNTNSLPTKTQTFLEEYCDLNNVPEGWYPAWNNSDHAWKLRAPYVVLVGVWNAGVSQWSRLLQQHPQLKRSAVPDFFLPRNFYKYLKPSPQKTPSKRSVFSARQRLYAQVYSKSNFLVSSKQVAMDVSPGYLFYADTVSKSIQCVTPWAKTIILLRDPVDRLYRQWLYGKQRLGLKLSLEEWIAQDWKALQSKGFIGGDDSDDHLDINGPTTNRRWLQQSMEYAYLLDPEQERQAWKDYQSIPKLAGSISRSIYVLQLEEWFETLEAVGKVPREHVVIIRAEAWEARPQDKYAQVLEFIGLAPFAPKTDLPAASKSSTSNASTSMSNETRKLLQSFFAPYNQRLSNLLKKYGFNQDGDWNEPIWN